MEKNINEIKEDTNQPRKTWDEEKINGMAETIKNYGLFKQIEIDQNNVITDGHRRLRALKIAGIKQTNVVIKSVSEEEKFVRQVISDIHHEQIPTIEKAEAIFKLKRMKKITFIELSKILGVSDRYLYKLHPLTDLPNEMKFAVENKQITIKELLEVRKLPQQKQLMALRQKIEAPKKFKINFRPKEWIRQMGGNTIYNIPTTKNESMKHFTTKCMLSKILKDKGRRTSIEKEEDNAIADVKDETNNYGYELQSNLTPKIITDKRMNFMDYLDVIFIDLNKVPNDIFEMKNYLENQIV